MAVPPQLKAHAFKPGNPGGPGRAKNWLKASELKDYIARYCRMTVSELGAVASDDDSKVIEVILAGVLLKIAADPDPSKLEYVLNRTVGRVVEVMEDTPPVDAPLSTVHRPDGTVHELKPPPVPTFEPQSDAATDGA